MAVLIDFLYYIFNTFIKFSDAIKKIYDKILIKTFNDKLYYYATYNINSKKYIVEYNFSNIFYILEQYIFQYNINNVIELMNDSKYAKDNIIICKFIKDNKINKIILDKTGFENYKISNIAHTDLKFVYVFACTDTITDIDLTHEFTEFSDSLILNNNINALTYCDILSKYANKKHGTITTLKLMLENNDYSEQILKDNMFIKL